MQYTIKAVRLLGGSGKFWISDLLRSFLVYSWGETGRPTAKPSCCV